MNFELMGKLPSTMPEAAWVIVEAYNDSLGDSCQKHHITGLVEADNGVSVMPEAALYR